MRSASADGSLTKTVEERLCASSPWPLPLKVRLSHSWVAVTPRGGGFLPTREEYAQTFSEPRQHDASVDQQEDDEGERRFAASKCEEHDPTPCPCVSRV